MISLQTTITSARMTDATHQATENATLPVEMQTASTAASAIPPPLWLLAEITYRCPLHCPFCYNPTNFATQRQELETEHWLRVLQEGREMGAVQCGFSGGEPLSRDDLEELVAEASKLGYYTNLLTSGVGLTEERLATLKNNGLDHIQLSFQDSSKEVNDFLSSTRTFDLKKRTAALIKKYDYPMVLNCVIHKLNIEHADLIIKLAHDMGAEYLEFANTQYYSWAFENREHLIPTRSQIAHAEERIIHWREKFAGEMKIYFVGSDYHDLKPKRCMNGWGAMFLTVTPDGTVLPCHTARMLPGLTFPNVREMSLSSIWRESSAFNRFRGTSWMKEPCRSCDQKEIDLGGCRCQAYLIAHDMEVADPVCPKSPYHHLVRNMMETRERGASTTPTIIRPLIFRSPKESKKLHPTHNAK